MRDPRYAHHRVEARDGPVSRRRRRRVLLPALLASAPVVSACATSSSATVPVGSNTAHTRIEAGGGIYEMDVTKDRFATRTVVTAMRSAVWPALPGAYAALGIPGSAVINAAVRAFGIANPVVAPRRIAGQVLSRFLSCGTGTTGPKADVYEVRFRVVSQIDSTTAGALLLPRISATARPHGIQAQPIECATSGRLEQLLADSLAAGVRRPGASP